MKEKCNISQGFTMVEIAIVLVIAAIIVGGVLAGKDLIDAAKINKQVSQFKSIISANKAFTLKYKEMPGDLTNATSVFSGVANITNGNGNNELNFQCAWHGYTFNNAGFEPELRQFWKQLHASEMFTTGINPTGTTGVKGEDFPIATIGNNAGIVAVGATTSLAYQYGNFNPRVQPGNWLVPNIWQPSLTTNACAGGMTVGNSVGRLWLSKWAYGIDKKMDDGRPKTGDVVAPMTFGSIIGQGVHDERAGIDWWYNGVTCYDDTTNEYKFLNEDAAEHPYTDKYHCTLFVRMTD